jgi:glyoxylase-like metal-dependent hydrolase (beta-lactamase superfamily II)
MTVIDVTDVRCFMTNRRVAMTALALTVAVVGPAAAQDARTVLQAASTAMGAGNVKTIQYSGTGWNAAVGQSFSPAEDWPRFEMTRYTRTIDYDAKTSSEQITRRQGNYPPQGGGGTPIQGEQQQHFLVSGNTAWNMQGSTANPVPAAAELRQLDILLTPHGFIKAALAANPTAVSRTVGGRKATVVSFTALGKYKVNGTFNDQNLLELVQTWAPNPVLGDMLYETRYTEYKDFAGVKFPTVLHSHQGDVRLNQGHNFMEVRVSSVQPNATVAALAVPDNVRQASAPAVRVESQKLADGTWLVAGGSHNSVALEFRDFITVIEAPLNEERSLAVIAEVQKLVPNKPIRYLVNTHHHFDHSGGLRTYVAEGATIITHQGNREFYDQVVFHPSVRTMQPDRLSLAPRAPAFETTSQKYVVSDGVRSLEVYTVQGLGHSQGMVIAYLPKEKMLVNADLYSPPAQGAQPPATPTAGSVVLNQNIQRLKLDVAQHVPIHGRVGTMEEFTKIVGAPRN